MNRLRVGQALSEYPAQAEYWRNWIATRPAATLLRRDLLQTQSERRPTAVWEGALGASVVSRVVALTQGDDALAQMYGTAVAAAVAAAETDTVEVCVQTVVAGRVFPLVAAVRRDADGRQLLVGVRGAFREAAAHLDVEPLTLLEAEGVVPTDFAVLSAADTGDALPGGATIGFAVADGRVRVVYRRDLFVPATARRLGERFIHAFATLGTLAPVRSVLEAPDAQGTKLIPLANDTARHHPGSLLLHQYGERQAAAHPDRIAVTDDGGLTYGEFNRRANRLARRLRELGAGPGVVVAVELARSAQELVALHAVLKAGAAYLPIDPTLPEARKEYMLRHSGATVAVGRDCPVVGISVDPDDPALAALDDSDLPASATERDLAYVIYTSGSTGRPKGVMVEHRAIVNRLEWMQRQYPLAPDDVVLHKTPIAFDVSLWETFWWSLAGCAVTTLPSGDERDPLMIRARIAEHRVTTVHFVPSMLRAFLPSCSGALKPTGLRRVFASGEALPTDTVLTFRRTFPEGAPALINLYGPTEAAVDVTHFDCTGHDMRRPVPLGTPIDNIRLRIVTRDGRPAPVGVPGELHIGGAGLARGYLGAPGLTAERFVPDPTTPGERSYRTGDAARWREDGTVEFLGRLDDQVKIRGHRVELGEIEHVLTSLDGIADCAVTVHEDSLCAYVVTRAAAGDAAQGAFDTTILRAALAERLPSYMVPAFFVPVDAIPKTHNGKRALGSLPPVRPAPSRSPRRRPVTGPERRLCEIFGAALGVDRVGPEDNFFELGGDSIKFIGVLAAARRAGLVFTFQDLFARPTVAQLAPLVGRAAAEELGPADGSARPFAALAPADVAALPDDAVDAYPLSSLQSGLLYEIAVRDQAVYHDVSGYRYDAPLDVPLFLRAVDATARRHPMLRTSFEPHGFSVPLQIVHRDPPAWCTTVDLTEMDEAGQQTYLGRETEAELATGFAVGVPGPVRIRLCLLGGDCHHLMLSYHAAALDGWSVNRLVYELFDTYFTLLKTGEEPAVEQSEAGYEEFVELEREAVGSAAAQEFWRKQLEGAEAARVPRVPGARLDRGSTIRTHEVAVGEELGRELVHMATGLGVPVKAVLLAAHMAVLSFVTGRDDVTTGYEHSGRPEREGADRTLGLFLNTLPFRVRTDAATWSELVQRVYELEVALLPHRRYPMAEMARQQRRPLFEAVFNFTHFHVLGSLARRHGAELRRVGVHSQTEFPLRAEFSRDAVDGRIALQLHYDGSVFDAAHAERLGGYYARALSAMAADPQASPFAHSLMSDEESRILAGWQHGPRRRVPGRTVLDRFDESVARYAEATAVSHGGRSLSYGRLDALSDRLARGLAARGVRRGDVVAVRMARGLPWAVSTLGIMKAGGVYLPQDPEDPAERLASMMRRSACRFVLTPGEYEAVLDESGSADAVAPGRPHPDDRAYTIFTSGSTGEPKGAVIKHRGMLNHLQAKLDDLHMNRDDAVAQVASQRFDISVWQLIAPWLVGGRSVIFDAVTDTEEFLQEVGDAGITILEVVPSLLDAMLETGGGRLSALRYLMVTGEAFAPGLSRRWFDAYTVPVVNAYGPTEASDDITHHVLHSPVDGERVPVGKPVINTNIYVLAENGSLAPPHTLGEIHVTGPCVGDGYLNDPDRTAAAFPGNTMDDTSASMYRTGDLGRWLPGGLLDCVGRRDQQVKLRGHRVELPEVELALARTAGIDQAFASVRHQGDRALLMVWYTGSATPDLARVRAAAAHFLPAYMLPDLIARLDRVPVTRNGKVDRNALAALPLPELGLREPEPPANEAEREIIGLFAEVLGIDPADFGAEDDFFDMGGHSLAAMTLVARSGKRFTVRDLLAGRTARALARRGPAGRAANSERALLVELAAPEDPELTVVCFPYAGGSPVGYLPVAKTLQEEGRVRVLALDLQGSRIPEPDELVGTLLTELDGHAGPVTVLGHCAGAWPALALARALPVVRSPRAVVAGAVVKSADPADHPVAEVAAAPDDTVETWVVPREGGAPAGAVSRAELSALRRDTALSNSCLRSLLGAGTREDHPLTVVVAHDDPVTRGHEADLSNWTLLAATPEIVRIEDGGHYLNETRPRTLASLLHRTATDRAPETPHAG
ncbi:non-ribosomal peptide synthetase [Streptomyces tendae]|uniref:non-ribosomal peptide synthetase n=1 Tax=Streptomyces tendae TaxID=1932 RepID=UPI0024935B00|nr:non-ribosomal peptide synthetase [Streptomyces tendae]